MSGLQERVAGRKTATPTGKKLDLMNAVLLDKRIDYYAKAVFNDLIRYRHAITGLCFPSDDTIAADIGGDRSRVSRSRRVLRKYGYIDWIKTGRANFYTFNHAAAGPMIATNKRDQERRKERREMLQREAQEVLEEKLDL
jgi:hypothetical protein